MRHLIEHINQDIKRSLSKDKDATEQLSKRNPTGKPWRACQQPKHQAPTISSMDKSEVRTTDVQLKRTAKMRTVIGLTTKHAVCCDTLII